MGADYDLCIIGGGINGAGIARDAAGRGLTVLLAEAQDLAGATSSASTKLIHGGLRYLEQYEFRLVREALREREVLLRAAPHIIRPMDFILPYDKSQRPAWMIRLGLFLYDHMGGRKILKESRSVDFVTHPVGDPLTHDYRMGFCYQDCWVDDARLVALNALDARERGADILTRTAVLFMEKDTDGKSWRLRLRNMSTGDEFEVTARAVVNAAGPWVRGILEMSGFAQDAPAVRLVKGSHIVVPRLYEGEQAYILQQADKRIVFAIPYEHNYTLIGTTDVPYQGDPAAVSIEASEIEYLCTATNRAFQKKVAPEDVIWTYSGVRPLLDDGDENASEVTRDYRLHLDATHGPPLLSVFGGKITTYRRLAEQAVSLIVLPQKKPWTENQPLPGGDIPGADFDMFLKTKKAQYKIISPDVITRYACTYGTRMDIFMKDVYEPEDLGVYYGEGIYEAEIIYLVAHEFARTLEDILWRRTKMGLHISKETSENIERALPMILYGVFGYV